MLEQLRLDLEVERGAIQRLNEGIELARSLGDNGSRDLLEDILKGEESHADWLLADMGGPERAPQAPRLGTLRQSRGVPRDTRTGPWEHGGPRRALMSDNV